MTDIAVIGGGLAGLAAAVRATELGQRVTVLEAGNDPDYLCNSRMTGGIFHIAMRSILVDSPEALKNIQAITGGHADPGLASALANNGKRAVDWLRAQGIRFIKGGPAPEFSTVLSPPVLQQFGTHWRGRAGDVLLRTLTEKLESRSGVIRRGARARSLLMQDGRCIGINFEVGGKHEQIRAEAVIIADGGFQASMGLVGRYISPAPEKLRQRNAQTGKGEGLQMAAEAGARLVGLDRFYGHVLHRDAMTNDRLWPHPMVDSMAVSGIVVDARAQRFTDEGIGGVSIANAIAQLEDPLSAVVICDDIAWNGPARDVILPPNPNLIKAGASVIEAGDIAGIAQAIGLPVEQLKTTIDSYNLAISNGKLEALTPGRSTHRFPPLTLKQAPFHAVPVCAGITYTMGGIAINDKGQVLDGNNSPITGLFAAGAATGGLEGGPFSGYTGGLSKAAVFGLIAAESIADATGQDRRYG